MKQRGKHIKYKSKKYYLHFGKGEYCNLKKKKKLPRQCLLMMTNHFKRMIRLWLFCIHLFFFFNKNLYSPLVSSEFNFLLRSLFIFKLLSPLSQANDKI